jgi:hypothetical protein
MIGLDILLGGVTGLLGNIITGVMKFKNQKLQFQHEARMVALETAAMKEEAKMKIAITRAEIEGAVELADAHAYTQTLKAADKQLFSDQWIERLFNVQGKFGSFFAIPIATLLATGFALVDWLRGIMRPALTIYLTVMSSIITWMAWNIMQQHGVEHLTAEAALGIYNQTTSIVIYLTVSCVTWWFGDRTMSKAIVDMRKEGTKN